MTSAQAIHTAWKTRREIALIDLREEAIHALGHPLFASCLPLSKLEIGLFDLLPRKDVAIVLFDAGDGLIAPALASLKAWGYTDVTALEGGLEGWTAAGLELFEDVNSPSKAFGELVEHRRGTPSVTAPELQRWIDEQSNVVVMDARRFDEYNIMSIPGSTSVPGAELVQRASKLAPDVTTTIVVNCAGRTRSIIGAQSLINAGMPNRVMALRNGTIGWMLEGQTLDTGQERRYPEVDDLAGAEAREKARSVAYRAGVRPLAMADLAGLHANRTLYRFDVRSPEEHVAGHPEGFRLMPGGQLVQETDMVAPVRGALMILFDDRGTRAYMTASWLAQMGWDCCVVEDRGEARIATGILPSAGPATPACTVITAEALATVDDPNLLILDLSPSRAHAKAHVSGSRFVMRGRFERDLPADLSRRSVVLVSPDGVLAAHASAWFAARAVQVSVLEGGFAAWRAAGLPTSAGMEYPLSPAEDVYRRPYEGLDNPREKMQAYLEWEYGLVGQLERDASHGFFVI